MRGFPPRAPLLAAALLLAACKPGAPAPAPGPAPAAPPPPPPPAAVAWDPEDLLPLPGEEVAAPGTGTTFLEGVVVDTAGRPVAGAAVELHAYPRVDTAAIPLLHASATAGPDGRFRVGPGPTPWWEQGQITARAPGFAPTTLRSSAMSLAGEPYADEGAEVRLVLRPGFPATGEVRGEDGGPPDAPVVAWVFGRQFAEVVKSDAAGNFTFTAPAGRFAVNVMDGPHPRARERMEVSAGGENRVRILVRRGSDVAGRVVDALTGRPVPGAVIRGYWGDSLLVRAAADGSFVVPRYWFRAFQVRAAGFAVRMHPVPETGGRRLASETVALDRGFTARGRVTGPDGKPVGGVRLRIFDRSPTGEWILVAGPATKPDGTYTFVGLPLPTDEREVRIFATGDAWAVTASEPVPGTSGGVVDGVDLRLEPLVEVQGRVVDEKGAPGVGVVSLEWSVPKGLERYRPLVPESVRSRTGADGKFRARVPASASLRVRAEGPLFRPGTAAGTTKEPLVVRVFSGLVMRGRVVDSRGDPVTPGIVHVASSPVDPGELPRDAKLDEEGRFEIGGLGEGLYDVSVAASQEFLHEATRGLRAGGEPVTILARRSGGISGRIVLPGDAPAGLVPEVTVRALGESRPLPGVLSRRIATSDRRFSVGPLTPGDYSFSAVAGDWRRDIEKVTVTELPGAELGDVLLAPAGAVTGTVRVLGKPAAGVPLEVLRFLPNGTAESAGRAESGPDGRFRFGGLREGVHVLAARPPGRPVTEGKFEAVAGAPTSFDIEVPAGAKLVVKVLGLDGKPAPGARVTISGPGGGVGYWKEGGRHAGTFDTGADGLLRCSGLPAGTLRVSANLPGGGAGEVSVTVADGAEAAVEVPLAR